ncbi:MAG: Ig-like domain-containing protein, partial [Nanoarchaeota archaeon]|nr:Ig-like domain-containing protein [Nanoarchaeota archaeon]
MKVNVELAIFFALLLVIAGTFLLLQQTTSITGAVITTLPTEETTLVESSNASSEQAVTIITETYAEPETIKKETSSIGIQGITIQNAPSIALVLNTTDISKNDTDTNLTAYNTTQTNGNSLKVIYNWLMNNSPIAVLNMPFEGINGTSGTTADNKTWDYSGLRNHGNETGGVLWNSTGGYDGKGAYMFDGANDYIGLSDNNSTRLACTNGCTINSWVYIKGKSTSASAVTTIVSRLDNLNNFLFFGTLVDLNRTYFIIYENKSSNSKLCSIQSTTNAVSWNSWVFVTGRYNLTHAATFIDGAQAAAEPCVLNSFTSLNATTWDNETPYNIGRGSGATSNVFNGTIDEVMIFNRSLSNEQIYALWRNQTNVITAQETILGENWSVHATPNNGTGDGTVVISNNLTILDKTPPNVTINFLNNPADNSNFSIRSSNQTFNASVFDSFTQISTVYFQFDNGTSADVNVTGLNTSGQWTVSYNVSTLAEGKQGVRIIANDTVNNINNSAVINFTVDFTSPNVTINSLNANTLFNASNYSVRSGNVTFNASAFDTLTDINRLFFWLDNGTGNDINITGINNSGQWTISYNVSALAEGRQGVRIVANDTVNNVNDSAIINFTVDFTGPNVTINSLNANTLFNASNFSVRSGNVTFNVSIFDALTGVSRVYFWLDNGTGNDINVTAVNQSGNWIVSYNVSTLAEGRQGVRIIANDTVNNVNDTYFMNFTVDFTSPNVTINSINANTLFNASNYSVRSGNVTFNASAFDTLTDINKLFFWLDNGTGNDINITGINNSGQWTISYNVSTLAEEKQGVRIIANDTVNNINDTYFMNFTVDFTSPNVTRNFLNNPVNDSNFSIRSSNQTFNASVFDSLLLLDTVYFWFDNGTSQDFNITGTNISGQWIVNYNLSTLAEGRQGVRIVANDTVNNVNDSAVINFTIDFTAPTVNITGPAAGATVSGIRNFNATVRDSLTDVGKVLFQFSHGTNPFNLTASNTSGMWNVSINTNSIAEGSLTITVFANDTVGNINNTKTVSVTIDNIAEPGSGGGAPSSSTSTSTTNI